MGLIKNIKKNWDWFETCKFASIGNGAIFILNFVLIICLIKFWNDWSITMRAAMIFNIIILEIIEYLLSKVVKMIREKNPDCKIHIK